jgi:23S rRNA (uracil1939-C5)-methyltransferase
MTELVLDITALAAGGDGLGRDANGRVTFVPRTAPGDRVRVRIVKQTASFARGELVEIVTPSPDRVAPACEAFERGCGGCTWLHVARAAQLDAKHAIVAGALRKLDGLVVERIADPCPPLGWRRRARFHVANGVVGLYREGTHDIVPLTACPQLEPELAPVLATAHPPDGELVMLRGFRGDIAVGDDAPPIELEPGLWTGARDFAQASAAGNAALVALVRAAVRTGPGAVLELYAGSGNLTRGLVANGWTVTATDVVAPPRHVDRAQFLVGPTAEVLARIDGLYDAIVLDPPRTGAAEAIAGIARLAPLSIVYVSCDPATLARDAAALVAAGYRADRAWPIDLMPQTAHVEVVLRLELNDSRRGTTPASRPDRT